MSEHSRYVKLIMNFNTVCLVFLGIIVVSFAKVELDPAAIQKIQETAGKCQTKTGATAADMEKMMKHDVPETQSGKCFLACMKKSLGFMNDDNSMNVEFIRNKMNEHLKDPEVKEKGLKIVDICVKEVPVESDECEMATKLMACCVKHSREMGIAELNILGA